MFSDLIYAGPFMLLQCFSSVQLSEIAYEMQCSISDILGKMSNIYNGTLALQSVPSLDECTFRTHNFYICNEQQIYRNLAMRKSSSIRFNFEPMPHNISFTFMYGSFYFGANAIQPKPQKNRFESCSWLKSLDDSDNNMRPAFIMMLYLS